jgi:chromate transporter
VLLGVSLAWPVTRPDGAGLWAGFFQAGALVFGGGHVVLPMLDRAVIARGWVSRDVFLSGYGAAQAVPGPLFTFAAFLGAVAAGVSHPVLGGVIALLSIFAPGLLLMTAALPFWGELRSRVAVAAALRGVNAGVVGILAAALWRPIGVSAVHSWADMAVAAGAFVALTALRLAPWMVVTAVGVIYGVAGLIR